MAESLRKITRIETQKRKKNRYSVFLNDEFAFGLDAAVVTKFNLSVGDQLSQEKVDDLLQEEEKRRVKEKAYRYLAGRAHSEKELRDKLLRKGFEETRIDAVIAELKDVGYLDDASFARSYAQSRLSNKPMGAFLLRRELQQKGVAEPLIKSAIEEAYSGVDEEELATELVRRRAARYRELEEEKKKKRLYDFLRRRGFRWEVVKRVIERTVKGLD